MECIFSRFSLEISCDERSVGYKESFAPAILKVPVIQTGQEDFIRRVCNNPVRLVFPLSNGGVVTVDKPRVFRSKFINCKNDLVNQFIAVLTSVETSFAGVLKVILLGRLWWYWEH